MLPQSMHYLSFDKHDDVIALTLAETDLPHCADHEVLIHVNAFGINRADTLQRQGKYPPPSGESPILGLEVAGTVAMLGTEVKDLKLGERVFGLVPGGGYAQYARINRHHVMRTPDNLSDQQAAGIAEVFLTAYQSLFELHHVYSGQQVLIHAGASGVGLACIQLAVKSGCKVAVTSSSEIKLNVCKKLGATHLINYKNHCFAEFLKAQQFAPDVIIDFIGGDYLNRNLKVLAQDGTIVQLAMLAGRYGDSLDMALLLMKRARLIGSTLRNRSDAYKSKLIARFSQQFLSKFNSGELQPNLDSIFPAEEVYLAHQRLENNDSMGKLIGHW